MQDYANQQIGWRQCIGMADDGELIHDAVKLIPGRIEHTRTLVRNAQGDQVLSEALVMTRYPVEVDDLLLWGKREWPVITVSTITGLMGEELHREVRL